MLVAPTCIASASAAAVDVEKRWFALKETWVAPPGPRSFTVKSTHVRFSRMTWLYTNRWWRGGSGCD